MRKSINVLVSLAVLLVAHVSVAQTKRPSFAAIDWNAQLVEAPTMDSLTRALTLPYATDLEKVRSIFIWVTSHISYKIRIPLYRRQPASIPVADPDDTAAVLRPLNERVAQNVFKSREAVCDGYARLFKTLCDMAGLRCEIITGYARTNFGQVGKTFLSNHSWNAVFIDSSWHLMDVTWASGVVSYRGDEFIRRYDDHYFFTPPQEFIKDHYPDQLTWSLMNNPPTVREFQHTPYKSQHFIKNRVQTFSPSRGIIEAAVGDEVKIDLDLADIDTNREEPDPMVTDTLMEAAGKLVNLHPVVAGRKLSYRFTVTSELVEWLNILYRNELVMRYRLDVLRPASDKQAVR